MLYCNNTLKTLKKHHKIVSSPTKIGTETTYTLCVIPNTELVLYEKNTIYLNIAPYL